MLIAALLGALPLRAAALSFALLGDTPYSHFEREVLPDMLAEMAAEDAAFAIHVGDIKGGRESCDDALLEQRRRLFDGAPLALVLTPGDNEWTDCDRARAGGFDPLERLARLREVFFADAESLGARRIALERQSASAHTRAYPENARWMAGGVLFVTVHVVGSRNNYRREPGARNEWRRRDAANRAWLAQSFALAQRRELAGVVVAMHANPWLGRARDGRPHPAYAPLLAALEREVASFPGEVLLVHGDTHRHRIDQPYAVFGAASQRFSRVEVYGSPFLGWVKVSVVPGAARLFRVESRPFVPRMER